MCDICEKVLPAGLEKTHIKCACNTVSLNGINGATYLFYRQPDQMFHCQSCDSNNSDCLEFIVMSRIVHKNILTIIS
jgi:hypothetical protein